jgi:hypothetical protein
MQSETPFTLCMVHNRVQSENIKRGKFNACVQLKRTAAQSIRIHGCAALSATMLRPIPRIRRYTKRNCTWVSSVVPALGFLTAWRRKPRINARRPSDGSVASAIRAISPSQSWPTTRTLSTRENVFRARCVRTSCPVRRRGSVTCDSCMRRA